MMPDVENEAVTLPLNGGLISAARLQIIVADKAHVERLRLIAQMLLLRGCRHHDNNCCHQGRSKRHPKLLRHDRSSLQFWLETPYLNLKTIGAHRRTLNLACSFRAEGHGGDESKSRVLATEYRERR
jgi:hypothetical protein